MALIFDPDSLNQGHEVNFIISATNTIQLVVSGNLTLDGVTLQALYSFCKEEWKTDSNLIKYPFPIVAITEQKFDLVNGWDFEDAATRNLIRNAGWALKDANNVSLEEYMGFITLGTVDVADQIYYQQSLNGAATNVVLKGAANQAVKIYGDAQHDSIDYRGHFNCYVREYQKLFDQSQLSAIGIDAVTYQVYSFPLSNQVDLKVTNTDSIATSPYSGMSITYQATPVERTIGTGNVCNFNVIVDGNGGTKEQIYEYVQYQLRQNSDIDAGVGTVTGKTANSLMYFVGDTLITTTGVFIDDFAIADTNSIEFYDNDGDKQTFPFVAAGRINFNDNLKNDTDAIYRMYFTTGFGTSGAVIVNDNNGDPISGTVSNASYVDFSFDYDSNVQNGRTISPPANVNVTIVAIGLTTGQYVSTTGIIAKSNANAYSLVSSLERNYSNPT